MPEGGHRIGHSGAGRAASAASVRAAIKGENPPGGELIPEESGYDLGISFIGSMKGFGTTTALRPEGGSEGHHDPDPPPEGEGETEETPILPARTA